MTYCVAMRLEQGLIFVSDSRTNAGIDHIATFRKLHRLGTPGERLIVMAPRPGRIFKEYSLPFAERGVGADLRTVKKSEGFADTREEILGMIWGMEEEIMGRAERAS